MVTAMRRVMLDHATVSQIAWDLEWFAATTAILLLVAIRTFSRRRLRHE